MKGLKNKQLLLLHRHRKRATVKARPPYNIHARSYGGARGCNRPP